ncbi:MAG: DoxX family membrane protein [Acidobacteriota bacterium]
MNSVSAFQQFVLVLIRFVIGWHLFYQGLGKLRAVSWSAQGYLSSAKGPFASFFQALADSPTWLRIADALTVWGLLIAGLLLMFGLFTRTAAVVALLLLLLFFLAAPPLPYMGFTVPTGQGSELYIDKTLIEALALLVVLSFPTGKMAGLDIFLSRRKGRAGRFDRY